MLGLVAPRSHGRITRRLEKAQAVEQRGHCFPFLRTNTALDLRDVDAARPEHVVATKEVEQKPGRSFVAPEMGDEDRGVEQVEAQAGDSVRRVFLTQAVAAGRSRQCP
jgi:hypothetical protein